MLMESGLQIDISGMIFEKYIVKTWIYHILQTNCNRNSFIITAKNLVSSFYVPK